MTTMVCFAVSASALTSGDYEYKVLSDGTVEISKYIGAQTSVAIPAKISGKKVTVIGKKAFCEKTSITSVTIPEGVKIIDDGAFLICEGLKKIVLPNSVTEIRYQAFLRCSKLESITLSENLTKIGNQAFSGCGSLKKLTIPAKVKTIGDEVFRGCSKISSITVDKNNKYFVSDSYGVLFDKNKTKLIKYPTLNSSTTYKIPETVKDISYGAFNACKNLTSVDMPEGLENIYPEAFSGCSNLKEVNLPDSVNTIGMDAFSNCEKITNIEIPEITSLGANAFYNCKNLKEVTMGEGITKLWDGDFSGCVSLESIEIPLSVTEIGYGVFGNCKSLKNVYYAGSKAKWEEIKIYGGNEYLKKAEIHFNYKSQNGEFLEKSYISDIWLDLRDSETKTPESHIIDVFFKYSPISSQIYDGLNNDKDFKAAVNTWNGLEVLFSGKKALEDALSEDELYETLIMSLIENVMKDSEKEYENIVLDTVSGVGKVTKKVTKYKKVIDDIATIADLSEKSILETVKEFKYDTENDALANFCNSINGKSYTKKYWSDNKFIKGIGDIAEAYNDVTDFYKRLTYYCMAMDMSEEMVIYLKEMLNRTNNPSFKKALNNVINAYQNADFVAMLCTSELADDMAYDFVMDIVDELSKKIPIYKQLKQIYKTGVAFVNLTMNTSDIIDCYYLCRATNNFMIASQSAIGALKNKYIQTREETDAGALVYVIRMYDDIVTVDLETSAKTIEAATEKGAINCHKKMNRDIIDFLMGSKTESTYESFVKSKNSIIESMESSLWNLENSWKFDQQYLKQDFPELYAVYVGDELSKKEYKPILNSAYLAPNGNTVINWDIPGTFYYRDDNNEEKTLALPAYSSYDGLWYKEEVGSYYKEVEKLLSDFTATTLQFNNKTNFSTFPKKYSLSIYTETVNGNVYSPAATVSIENPVGDIKVSFPSNMDSILQELLSYTINKIVIEDSSFNSNTPEKYEIYRQLGNNGEWKLIDTVSGDNINRKGQMLYTDEEKIPRGTLCKYKVRSRVDFTNGKTLYSDMSNVIAFNNSPTVKNQTVRTKVTNNIKESFLDFTEVEQEYYTVNGQMNSNQLANTPAPDLNWEDLFQDMIKNYVKLEWDAMDGAQSYDIYRMVSYGEIYQHLANISASATSYKDYDITNGETYDYVVLPVSKLSDIPVYDTSICAQGGIVCDLGKVYSVTWNMGEISRTQKYLVGSKVVPPTVVTDSGYEFTGWSAEVPETMPEKDLVFTACYKYVHKHNYKLTFTKESTCSTEGFKGYSCECHDTYTEKIAKKSHTSKTTTTKATLTKNGKSETKCTVCGAVTKKTTIYYPETISLSKLTYTYDGKVKTPPVTVNDSKGNALKKDTDYTVKYESGRKETGKYTVTITFKGKYTGTKTLYFAIAPKAPAKLKATQNTSAIKLSWEKVTGATGYRIFYKSGSEWKIAVDFTTETSHTFKKLKAGKTYKMKIKAFKKDGDEIWSAYSDVIHTGTKPETPDLKVTSPKKATVTIAWKNVAGESGYEIYYSSKKDGTYKKKGTVKADTSKITLYNIKSGKTYYVRVRAFIKTSSGTIYGGYNTVAVKVK